MHICTYAYNQMSESRNWSAQGALDAVISREDDSIKLIRSYQRQQQKFIKSCEIGYSQQILIVELRLHHQIC